MTKVKILTYRERKITFLESDCNITSLLGQWHDITAYQDSRNMHDNWLGKVMTNAAYYSADILIKLLNHTLTVEISVRF